MKRATVYLKRGNYYIYASSRTTKGFWIASAPFLKANQDDLGSKVLEALDRSKVGIAAPDYTEVEIGEGLEPILHLSNTESWRDFVKGATCCHVSLEDEEIKVMPTMRSGLQFNHKPKLSVSGTLKEVSELLVRAFDKCR